MAFFRLVFREGGVGPAPVSAHLSRPSRIHPGAAGPGCAAGGCLVLQQAELDVGGSLHLPAGGFPHHEGCREGGNGPVEQFQLPPGSGADPCRPATRNRGTSIAGGDRCAPSRSNHPLPSYVRGTRGESVRHRDNRGGPCGYQAPVLACRFVADPRTLHRSREHARSGGAEPQDQSGHLAPLSRRGSRGAVVGPVQPCG